MDFALDGGYGVVRRELLVACCSVQYPLCLGTANCRDRISRDATPREKGPLATSAQEMRSEMRCAKAGFLLEQESGF
jgi:hypothetical protein